MGTEWLSRHRYQLLLAALLLVLVAYPLLRGQGGSPLLARGLLTVLFVAGGGVVLADRWHRVAGLALGAPALLGAWTGYALPDRLDSAAAAGLHLTATAFHLFVLAVLLRRVYREPTVTVDVVAAALCGYLLTGVAFGHAYCLVDAAVPGSFGGLDPAADPHRTHFHLTYFSFMTLTTVGYGDITPTGDAARALVLVEAVTGQFYLAVLVADLVGKRVGQALSPGPPPPA